MSKLGVVNEIHRNVINKFPRRYVVVKGLNDLVQIDLLDVSNYADVNKGFKFILTGINMFTKFGYAIPVLNKSGVQVTEAFKKMLQKMKYTPINLQSDRGSEFFNKHFKAMVKKLGINHYHTYSSLKASGVERFNRSFRKLMHTQFSYQGSYDWLSNVDTILKKYNSRIHRTTHMAPSRVGKKDELRLLKTVYKQVPRVKRSKFQVGDRVRISKVKSTFEKGYTPNWSTELFDIAEVRSTNPEVYILQDLNGQPIQGTFYKQELLKTRYPDTYLVEKILRRKNKQVFVKWLGFTEPTWEPETNLNVD